MNKVNNNNRISDIKQTLGTNKGATEDELKKLFDELHRGRFDQEGRFSGVFSEKEFQEIMKTLGMLIDKFREERERFWAKLYEVLHQIRVVNVKGSDGNWTRESDILHSFLKKRGMNTVDKNFFDINEKTKLLFEDIFSSCTCECLSLSSATDQCISNHIIYCLKTHQEIEEFSQKVIKNFKEAMVEFRQVALADEESVKAVDQLRKNGGCVGCHQEQNKNNIDNKPTLVSDEKRNNDEQSLITIDQANQPKETKNNSIVVNNQDNNNEQLQKNNSSNQETTNQNSTEISETTLIAQLKAAIAELKKNLDPNNAEQNIILAQKETELAKLLENIQKSQKNNNNNSGKGNKKPKGSNKVPMGIILIPLCLLIVGIGIIVLVKKKKKSKKIQ